MLKGVITKNISDTYTVKADGAYYNCKARGKFRNTATTPLVGDYVMFDEVNNYILNVDPRKNELDRPHVSNVDIALLVTSLKKPDLSLNLLDKELTSVILANVEAVICFTKLDLLTSKELEEYQRIASYYSSIGIKVFDNTNLDALCKYLKGKVVVLTGQTGAGKSSLINKLDSSFNIKTDAISEALGRGKHTTRHTEIYEVKGIFIADTPGFSALDLTKYSKEDIKRTFLEFNSCTCEFKDCMHIKERNCGVKDEVLKGNIRTSRYDNYKSFIK